MTSIEVRLSGTNLERAADHNQRTTLHAIRVHGAITRIALAHVTGLSAPAIANIIKRLIDEDLVAETGRLRKGRGQPGKVLEINPAARFSFGINIDRDHLSMVLVNFLGEVLAKRSWDQAFLLPDEVKTRWQANAIAMLQEAGASTERLSGIGVAIPDDLGNIFIPGSSTEYSRWREVSVEALFAQPFDIPVIVENDAKAAALGEQQFGLGPQFQSMFYLLISAGLGGAFVTDGQVLRGANGRSGEIGLIPIDEGKLVQDRVALACLSGHLAAAGHELSDLYLEEQGPRCSEAVDAWIREATDALIYPLMAATCILNPAVILIGSRLPAAIVDSLAASLQHALATANPKYLPTAPIRTALLSDTASAVGAAILPFIHFHLPTDNALWKVG